MEIYKSIIDYKGFIMAKKKTYMFSEETIQTLEKLKKITNKKETQIISEALDAL